MTAITEFAALRAVERAFAVDEYISLHNDVKPLVYALRAAKEHNHAVITIDAGKAVQHGFQSYLSNRIENPKIHVNLYRNVPQIIIRDRLGIIAGFSLDAVKNLTTEHIICSLFESWEFAFCYGGVVDYRVKIELPMMR